MLMYAVYILLSYLATTSLNTLSFLLTCLTSSFYSTYIGLQHERGLASSGWYDYARLSRDYITTRNMITIYGITDVRLWLTSLNDAQRVRESYTIGTSGVRSRVAIASQSWTS